MKRTVAFILLFAMLICLCGCAGEQSVSEPSVTLRVAGLKGPTSMGLVSLMNSAEVGESAGSYEFSVVTSADEITPQFIKGELDLICVPANLASVLYNKTEGQVSLVALNTLGVLYIVAKGKTVSSLSELKGETIYATGKGAVPEYSLRYLLTKAGLDPDKDVTIEFKSEPTEIVSVLKNADSGVAMLPEPFVTVATSSVEGLSVCLDLSEQWQQLSENSAMVTGVIVARSEVLEKYPEAINTFISEYKASVAFINNNTADGAALVEKYGITKATVAEKAIPACNLVCMTGAESRTLLEGYLQALYEQNPAAVGGKLPDDDFYPVL